MSSTYLLRSAWYYHHFVIGAAFTAYILTTDTFHQIFNLGVIYLGNPELAWFYAERALQGQPVIIRDWEHVAEDELD